MDKWLSRHAGSLEGKTVAVTGATGGLGSALSRYVLMLGGRLILLTRDPEKTDRLTRALRAEFPRGEIDRVSLELTDMASVEEACRRLETMPVDILVLNAGDYCLPRTPCATGYDPVFQINFAAQYYMARRLLPLLIRRKGRIAATGSIAYSGSETDPRDLDFRTRTSPELVYGNSKRRLMFSLAELARENPEVHLAIAHPGISFTNITSHYPRRILPFVKYSMKLLFMHPARAARGMALALTEEIPPLCWIGPRVLHIWGNPEISPLKGCDAAERQRIYAQAEEIYSRFISESASESTAEDDPAGPT